MSSNVFRKESYGLYYYYEQLIELNNDTLGIEPKRAQEVIQNGDKADLSHDEFELYKTFIHESVHFIDSTATLWGIEYSVRLFNCLENNNPPDLINVFLLGNSEIDQHVNLKVESPEKTVSYSAMRSILSYDETHGVHLQFKYYDKTHRGLEEVFSVPISMLAVLEGHAFAQETLFAISTYQSKCDLAAISFLENDYKRMLVEADKSEYTCIMAFVEQLFESRSFEEKLKILNSACRLALDLPILLPFPDQYIDDWFQNADVNLVSSLKMDLKRGMNRSSLVILILLGLSNTFSNFPVDKEKSFDDELEDKLFDTFRYEGETAEQYKQKFHTYRDIEYQYACTVLKEKGAELAYKSATKNKDRGWFDYDQANVFLPSVLFSSGEFAGTRNNIDFDMESHFYEGDSRIKDFATKVDEAKAQKPHLSPEAYHDWLQQLNNGVGGVTL